MTAQHRSHRLARLLAAGVTAAALAAPAAVARPIDGPNEPVRPDPGETVVVEAEHAPVVQKIDDGFDWGSAAIGAGSGGALVVIVALGGVAYSSRHRVGLAR
ncbi:MAG TPA: hypothetical protein VNO82_25515 [Solirubrobacteraceae bacterium]|nr:hypothetical protein [Solirubrobacteraceae bacterium]